MQKKVAVLAVHGMGSTERTFADKLKGKLESKLGVDWRHVYFDTERRAPQLQSRTFPTTHDSEIPIHHRVQHPGVCGGVPESGHKSSDHEQRWLRVHVEELLRSG